MTKGALADALATEHGMKKSECGKVLDSLASIGAAEGNKTSKFTILGLCMIKTRKKPATKATTRETCGKIVKVSAKPAKIVVKAVCITALQKRAWNF